MTSVLLIALQKRGAMLGAVRAANSFLGVL